MLPDHVFTSTEQVYSFGARAGKHPIFNTSQEQSAIMGAVLPGNQN